MLDLVMLTYNEEERLRPALSVARKWANKIFIFDKTSTDSTRAIAESFGCHVIEMPFSRQGHEDYLWMDKTIKALKGEDPCQWLLVLTPGEIPTRELIANCQSIAEKNPDHDVVCLPVRLHSFGKFLPGSPWSSSSQPRLLNLKLVSQRNQAHNNIVVTERSARMADSESCHIYHPTHKTFDSFLKSHVDYVYAENHGHPYARAKRAIQSAESFDPETLSRLDGDPRQFLAWKAYHYLVALRSYDEILCQSTSDYYDHTRDEYTRREWGAYRRPGNDQKT